MGSLTIWILIAAGTLITDIITSAFLFVWFTIGAIAAIIAEIFGGAFSTQLIIFIVVSIITMALGYPVVKKTIKKTVKKTFTTEETYVGRVLTVDEDIAEKAIIKLDGIYWTVKNEGESIRTGDKIQITGIEGNKFKIKKVREE